MGSAFLKANMWNPAGMIKKAYQSNTRSKLRSVIWTIDIMLPGEGYLTPAV